MRKFQECLRDESGGAMVETALALPVFLSMLWGIVQFGLAMFASNGIGNALGEGARFATICVQPTLATGCRRPSNQQIIDRINDRRFGLTYGSYGVPTVTAGDAAAPIPYIDIAMTYSMPTNLILVNGPVITFEKTKRVYVTGQPLPAA